MRSLRRYAITRLLAAIAVILQAVLPGSIAHAHSDGWDVSDLICATPAQLAPESRANVHKLMDLLDDRRPSDLPLDDEHCALCVIAQSATLAEPVILSEPANALVEDDIIRFQTGLVNKAHGPPLGSRGPPSHI